MSIMSGKHMGAGQRNQGDRVSCTNSTASKRQTRADAVMRHERTRCSELGLLAGVYGA